jgi:3-hydroxy-9,10-secoandrosta-1,3,5(10)-triene-9,17-dione monooxygenase
VPIAKDKAARAAQGPARAAPDSPHAAQHATADDLLERARALRPVVEERAAETEQLARISEDLHRRFDEAGFYRMLMPKRYGGLEIDLPTYVQVWMEIARGDASAAWCGCLAANHSLQVGSWWPEKAQDEIFGTKADFKAASVAAPLTGFARRVEGGWELNGKVSYCSGIPYATHYVGQALPEPSEKGGPPGPPMMFVAPRSAFEILDDWGELIGLIGSGSNSIVFDRAVVPAHWVLENTHMADVDVTGGTVGSRLHGNSMYATRGLGFFTMTVGAVMVGAALGALDEFERLLKGRKTIRAPFVPWAEDPDHQRWFGTAITKLKIAEIATIKSAEMQMELGRATVEDGRPYTFGDDQLVAAIAREAYSDAWQTMQNWIFRYSGSSAARRGQKLERVLRDMAIGWSHFNTANNEWSYAEVAKARLGLPHSSLF